METDLLHFEILTEVIFPCDGIIDKFVGCAFEDDASVVDQKGAVGDGEGFTNRVIRDEDGGLSFSLSSRTMR